MLLRNEWRHLKFQPNTGAGQGVYNPQNGQISAAPQAQFQQPQQQAPVQQQTQQPQPQYQPFPPQQQVAPQQPVQTPVQQQPTFTLPLPNLSLPNQPVQQQPQQPQTQADFSAIHQALAQQLNMPVEHIQQTIGNDPAKIAQVVGRGYSIWQQQQNQAMSPPSQTQPQQQQPTQPAGPTRYELPVGWESTVRQTDSGTFEPIHPSYSQIAAMANHNAALRRSTLLQIGDNPASVLQLPEVQKVLNEHVNSTVSKVLSEHTLKQEQTNFLADNAKHLFVYDNMGREIADPITRQPMRTPFGNAFNQAITVLAQGGMKESRQMYQTAMLMAQAQTGMNPNQPQSQQPLPPGQNNGAAQQYIQQGQQPQQQQPQYQPPQQDPVQQALAMNSQQNRLWPGGAQQRPNPQPQSFREAILQATSHMPDGLPIGAYLAETNGRR